MYNEVVKVSTQFYGIDGKECDESLALAKIVTTKTGNIYRYVSFCRTLNNPYNYNTGDKNKSTWKLVKVNEKVFKLYLKFLTSHNDMYLLNAFRIMN